MTPLSPTDEKLAKVFPDLAVRWRRVAEDMWNAHQMRIRVTDGLRNFGTQWELFARGRKKLKTGQWVIVDKKLVVTNAMPGLSLHQYGLAIDVCFVGADPYLDKLPRPQADFYWAEYGRFCKAHGLQWGGDFNGNNIKDKEDFDRPHCQMKYGMSIHEIQQLFEYGGIKSVWYKCNQILEERKT